MVVIAKVPMILLEQREDLLQWTDWLPVGETIGFQKQ